VTGSKKVDAAIEDVRWMVDNGAGWQEVVARVGKSETALLRCLERRGERALITKAKSRDTLLHLK